MLIPVFQVYTLNLNTKERNYPKCKKMLRSWRSLVTHQNKMIKVMFLHCLNDHEEDLLEICLMFRLKGMESSQNLYDLNYHTCSKVTTGVKWWIVEPIWISKSCLYQKCMFKIHLWFDLRKIFFLILVHFSSWSSLDLFRNILGPVTRNLQGQSIILSLDGSVSYSNITTVAYFTGNKYLLGDSAFTPSQRLVPCLKSESINNVTAFYCSTKGKIAGN